jgi:hypothetical protein
MEQISPWWPVLTSLVSAWLAYRIGFRKGRIDQRTLDLSINKARPRVGSRVELRTYSPQGYPHVRRNAIFTKIYNDGDLVARNVEGEWKLTAPEGLHSGTKTIREDSLSTALPWETQYDMGGNAGWLQSHPEITIQVDIDLVYSGLDEKREPYHATYRYDAAQKAMIKIGA